MPKQHAKRYFAIEVIWKPSGATNRCLVEDTVGLGGDNVGVIVEGTAFEIDGSGKPVAEKIKSTTVHRIELDEFKKEFASQKWEKVSLPLGPSNTASLFGELRDECYVLACTVIREYFSGVFLFVILGLAYSRWRRSPTD